MLLGISKKMCVFFFFQMFLPCFFVCPKVFQVFPPNSLQRMRLQSCRAAASGRTADCQRQVLGCSSIKWKNSKLLLLSRVFRLLYFFFSDVKGYMLDSKFSGVVFWHLHLLVWWYIKLMNSTKLHSPEDLLYVHCWLSCIGVKAVGAQVPRDWMAKRCKEPVWVWANQM